MSILNTATIQLDEKHGNTMQILVLSEKTFRTGSKGLYAQGKIQAGEKRYQVNILLVEIGTKPKQ